MIETAFDLRSDARELDPDVHSATLRRYHQLLWSKPLPSRRTFDLVTTTPGVYLHHRSRTKEFWLSSDTITQTFVPWTSVRPIICQLNDDEIESFYRTAYTIGGMIIFPGNKINGMMTINGARGFNKSISDRFDLTLECIRRHYLGEPSPLGIVLDRYSDFFELFDTFPGYVEFFLLQDLVNSDCDGVEFFLPFDNFQSVAVPADIGAYRDYRRRSIDFVAARNHRIDQAALQFRAEPDSRRES